MIEERPLLLQIQQFMRDHGMARTRFGREAVGDPRLVDDLCGGREPSQRVRDKVRGFIAEQRARGVPVVAEKPRREPVRRAPAPVSELNLRAAAPRPRHDVLPTREGERRQRSNAPRLIAEVLLRGGGALELIDATERDWFSATFEGARHRLRFALAKDAALPPAVARLTAQDIELRGGMVIDCRVQRGEGAAVGEVTVDLLTVDAMGEP